eukprot:scaffold7808_cov184-Amphora_coffeaeformis.AAC.8
MLVLGKWSQLCFIVQCVKDPSSLHTGKNDGRSSAIGVSFQRTCSGCTSGMERYLTERRYVVLIQWEHQISNLKTRMRHERQRTATPSKPNTTSETIPENLGHAQRRRRTMEDSLQILLY